MLDAGFRSGHGDLVVAEREVIKTALDFLGPPDPGAVRNAGHPVGLFVLRRHADQPQGAKRCCILGSDNGVGLHDGLPQG